MITYVLWHPEYHLAVVITMFNFVLQYSTRVWGCPDTQPSALLPGNLLSADEFSNNPTLHILNSGKICRVELCTELFYASIPTFFNAFC